MSTHHWAPHAEAGVREMCRLARGEAEIVGVPVPANDCHAELRGLEELNVGLRLRVA